MMRPVTIALLLLPLLATAALAVPGAPPGWTAGGPRLQDYEFGTDAMEGATGKQAAYIKARTAARGALGALVQCVKADNYIGQRLRFAARLKGVEASGVQLFMRVEDKDRKVTGFYNMMDRPIRGSTEWRRTEVVLDVPKASAAICYGIMLVGGKGEAWADGLSLTKVGQEVAVSRMPPLPPGAPSEPFNLAFERQQ